MSTWQILPLADDHNRSPFSCGQPSLDDFLKKYAKQNEGKDYSRTFVLLRGEELRVFGYYSLSAGEIDRTSIPTGQAKRLPKHPAPAVVLGRLAVDGSLKGQGFGKRLLFDAFQRCLAAGAEIGIYAVVVNAIDATAARFYQRFGFIPLVGSQLDFFLPLRTIRATLGT